MQRPAIVNIPPGSTGPAFYNTLNNNFNLLADAAEKALDRFGSLPNQMESNLDMNSFRIINCADPVNPSDVVTLRHLRNYLAEYIASTRIRWRGLWSIGETYEPWDLVYHNGSVYITTDQHNATSLNEPGVGADWDDVWDVFLGFVNWTADLIQTTNCPIGPLSSSSGNVQDDLCILSNFSNTLENRLNNLTGNDIATSPCPTGPLVSSTGNVQGDLCVLSNSLSSALNIPVNACPSGPVNTNTNVQDAICTLSSSIGGERLVAVNSVVFNPTLPGENKVPFNRVLLNNISGASFNLATYELTLPPGFYLIKVAISSLQCHGFTGTYSMSFGNIGGPYYLFGGMQAVTYGDYGQMVITGPPLTTTTTASIILWSDSSYDLFPPGNPPWSAYGVIITVEKLA